MFLTKEQLTRAAKVVDVEVPGLGTAKIRELTRSRKQELDSWYRPNGKKDSKKEPFFDLKLTTLCLENGDGHLMFDFEKDSEFDEFAEQINESPSGPWSAISHEVLKVNGYITEVDDDLLGKSDSSNPTPEDSLPTD